MRTFFCYFPVESSHSQNFQIFKSKNPNNMNSILKRLEENEIPSLFKLSGLGIIDEDLVLIFESHNGAKFVANIEDIIRMLDKKQINI